MDLQLVHHALDVRDFLCEILGLLPLFIVPHRAFQRQGAVEGGALNLLRFEGGLVRELRFELVFNGAVELRVLLGSLDVILPAGALNLDLVSDLVSGGSFSGDILCPLAAIHAADNSAQCDGSRAAILRDCYAAQIVLIECVVNGHPIVRVLPAVAAGDEQTAEQECTGAQKQSRTQLIE